MAKCGEQYCNPYCKNKLCVEMTVLKLANELGIKLIVNPLSIDEIDDL